MKKTIERGNLRIELDSDQIIPDDPGAGCPALVIYTDDEDGKEYEGTFFCALETGEVDCIALPGGYYQWLRDAEDEVDAFLEQHGA